MTERRRLDAELVRRGLARSRARAVDAIAAHRVTVSGAPATSGARLVGVDEPIHVSGDPDPYVSRGGHKLAAALDAFSIDVRGRNCLDAGASTGGFTDCLLQRGAAHVVAVDVGRGQLDWRLRNDPRVDLRERTNVRTLSARDIESAVDLVVADLSFISLRSVAAALVAVAGRQAEFVLLVKPQFEAGRSRVGKGGVVRSAEVHEAVLEEVVAGLSDGGLGVIGLMSSPLKGADGNLEFLAHARRGNRTVSDEAIHRTVLEAHGSTGDSGMRTQE